MPTKWFTRYHLIPELNLHLNPKYYLKEETAIYLTHMMKFLALALISIYVPMYIFSQTKGYLVFHSNEVLNGILWTLLYYTIKSFLVVIIIVTLAPIIFSKLNFQRSLILSSLAQILEIVLLMKGENNLYILLSASIFSALELPFYWIPYHLLFIKKTHDSSGHFGQKTGLRFFISRIVSGISPLIGGVILSTFGYNTLFVSAIVMLLASNIPIITLVNEWKHHKHTIENVVKKFVFNKKYNLITTALCGQALQAIVLAVFWPVLLLLVLQNYVEIGLLNSISLIATSVALLVVGKWIDKGKSQLVHSIGVTFSTILDMMKVFISTSFGIFTISIADKLNGPMYGIPNMSLFYEKAQRLGPSDFIIYRELVIHAFIVFSAIIIALLLTVIPNWQFFFIFASLGSLMAYAIDFDKN